MLTDKEKEALEVVIGALNDSWYRDVLQSLLDRSKEGSELLKKEKV